jgi:branched-chain amino acid transport system permease protein
MRHRWSPRSGPGPRGSWPQLPFLFAANELHGHVRHDRLRHAGCQQAALQATGLLGILVADPVKQCAPRAGDRRDRRQRADTIKILGQPNEAARAILSLHTGLPVILCMIAGGLLASVLGMIIAIPSVKLVHHFLAMVTIGFGEIVRLLALNGGELTGAADGIPFIPKLALGGFVFDSVRSYYYFVLAAVLVLLTLKQNLVGSRIGRAFRSIRDNADAASAFGVNVHRMKVTAFTIEGFFGGFGGALYAHLVGFISPETFGLQQSVLFLTMVLLGGGGTLWGPILGAVIISILFEVLQPLGQAQMATYGLIIMGVVMFMPRGIVGKLREWSDRSVKRMRKNDETEMLDETQAAEIPSNGRN